MKSKLKREPIDIRARIKITVESMVDLTESEKLEVAKILRGIAHRYEDRMFVLGVEKREVVIEFPEEFTPNRDGGTAIVREVK